MGKTKRNTRSRHHLMTILLIAAVVLLLAVVVALLSGNPIHNDGGNVIVQLG